MKYFNLVTKKDNRLVSIIIKNDNNKQVSQIFNVGLIHTIEKVDIKEIEISKEYYESLKKTIYLVKSITKGDIDSYQNLLKIASKISSVLVEGKYFKPLVRYSLFNGVDFCLYGYSHRSAEELHNFFHMQGSVDGFSVLGRNGEVKGFINKELFAKLSYTIEKI